MKNKFKGTQGNWEVANEPFLDESNGIYHGGFDIVNDLESKKITSVPAYEFWGQTFETAKANAKLISKAPEMLDMLKSCSLAFEQIGLQKPMGIEQLIKEATEI